MADFNIDTVFIARDDVVACDLDGGKALLDLSKSEYYKLNDTAALIWEWIGESANCNSLAEKMMGRFKVEEGRCKEDVKAIISSFLDAGIIETKTV